MRGFDDSLEYKKLNLLVPALRKDIIDLQLCLNVLPVHKPPEGTREADIYTISGGNTLPHDVVCKKSKEAAAAEAAKTTAATHSADTTFCTNLDPKKCACRVICRCALGRSGHACSKSGISSNNLPGLGPDAVQKRSAGGRYKYRYPNKRLQQAVHAAAAESRDFQKFRVLRAPTPLTQVHEGLVETIALYTLLLETAKQLLTYDDKAQIAVGIHAETFGWKTTASKACVAEAQMVGRQAEVKLLKSLFFEEIVGAI